MTPYLADIKELFAELNSFPERSPRIVDPDLPFLILELLATRSASRTFIPNHKIGTIPRLSSKTSFCPVLSHSYAVSPSLRASANYCRLLGRGGMPLRPS
jgi:hypothetical protein